MQVDPDAAVGERRQSHRACDDLVVLHRPRGVYVEVAGVAESLGMTQAERQAAAGEDAADERIDGPFLRVEKAADSFDAAFELRGLVGMELRGLLGLQRR